MLPALHPTIRSGFRPLASNTFSTPRCAYPRAEPPESTSATLGRRASGTGAKLGAAAAPRGASVTAHEARKVANAAVATRKAKRDTWVTCHGWRSSCALIADFLRGRPMAYAFARAPVVDPHVCHGSSESGRPEASARSHASASAPRFSRSTPPRPDTPSPASWETSSGMPPSTTILRRCAWDPRRASRSS